MSLKAGSRIRTYKPVVYKPSENAIVISDKNNDRKFMFLSEETQPDYRPIEVRNSELKKPCPRIDHRPLGADSYSIKVRNSIHHLLCYCRFSGAFSTFEKCYFFRAQSRF